MKKKWIAGLLSVAIVATLLTGCGSSANKSTTDGNAKEEQNTQEVKELNIFTWDGMFPQEILDGFEMETGIKINYSNFDTDEAMLAKLEETKGGEYDLVIADDYIIETVIAEGLAQKLDTLKLNNYKNINPLFQGYFYDENNEYTIPHGAGVPVIVYDPNAVDVEIKSYADLWNPAFEDNVALIGNYRVINGITLKTMGESFNTNDLTVIQSAGDKLLELAPNVRLVSDSNTQDYLISGEAAVGFLYTSQAFTAVQNNPDLKVVYPEEGLGFGIMAGFIPSNAPHADAAYQFLDYILDAKNSAKCFEYLGYYCTNKAAEQYIDEHLKESLVLPAGTEKGEIIMNVSAEAEELHSKIWTEFLSACE